MNSLPLVPPEVLATTRNRWDAAAEMLLAALLLFMPLAFGAVDAWSELVALVLAAALTLLVLIRAVIDRTFALVWTWAYVPLGLFILLVTLQRLPLPSYLVASLSPAAVQTPTDLLGDAAAKPSAVALSAYPLATTHGLRMVMLGAAVFFATVSVFQTAPQVRRLLTIVFGIGCAQAALALLQIFTRTDRLYWAFDAGGARLTSGSFINYSNFSQFMNLSIGAGVALLLVRLLDEKRLGGPSSDATRAFGGARLGDYGGLLLGLVVCVVAVFASLSRNGAISLAIASLVVGVALFARGDLRRRGWVLAILPLAAFAVFLSFGFDALYDRFAAIKQSDQLANRWELTLGALRAWQAYPVWGAGLGTHAYIFPMFDESLSASFAEHADNDYAQLLEETGIVGAACVIAFLAIIGWQLVAVCRRGRSAISAAAFGLALGLIAVAIHSASDFGQRVPAVFCLSAVSSGLVISLSRLGCQSHVVPLTQKRIAWRRTGAAALTVCVALAWTWALQTAYASHRAAQWWAAALQVEDEIAKAGLDATDTDYSDLLAAASQAVDNEPANVEYAYWLNVYRWRSLTRQIDPSTGQALVSPAARPFVTRIADALSDVRKLCPTFGPPYGFEGQLRLFVLDQDQGGELIRQGVRLAPYDPPTCFTAGELAARAGRADEAIALLRRAVAIAPQFFPDAAVLAFDVLNHPDFARELAADDYQRLDHLATIAGTSASHAGLTEALHDEAHAALRRQIAAGKAGAVELAALGALDASIGNHSAAADHYRRALLLSYSQIEWRLARARSLIEMGDDKQALREANICLSLRPNHAAARQLADELILRLAE